MFRDSYVLCIYVMNILCTFRKLLSLISNIAILLSNVLKVRIPSGRVASMLDCNIVASEFKFQSCFYVHFWTNTLGKGINFLIPSVLD